MGRTNPSCPSLSPSPHALSWSLGNLGETQAFVLCFLCSCHTLFSATVALLPPSASSARNKRSLCEIWLSNLSSASVPDPLKLQQSSELHSPASAGLFFSSFNSSRASGRGGEEEAPGRVHPVLPVTAAPGKTGRQGREGGGIPQSENERGEIGKE